MKVAILTFFNNGNFGSELQAIAMGVFLQNLGYNPVFCKCGSTKLIGRIVRLISRKCKEKIYVIFNKEFRSMNIALRENALKQCAISLETRKKIHEDSKKLICSTVINTNKLKYQFDAYICGSDQIWSPFIMPLKKEYYLPFVPTEKKIAYGPSFGVSQLPEYHKNKIYKMVDKFKFLSVRESNAIPIVQNLCGKTPKLVCDPTILISSEKWNELVDANIGTEDTVKAKYVFTYFLGRMEKELHDIIITEFKDFRIILQPKQEVSFSENIKSEDMGLFSFLNGIRNAEYVITDSFHGTVFSVLFKKKFVVFSRNNVDKIKQVSRLDSFLAILGITHRFWNGETSLKTLIQEDINYDQVLLKLKKYQKQSQIYLQNALKEIEEKNKVERKIE